MRELFAEKARSAEIARARQPDDHRKADLPAVLGDAGEHTGSLERRLLIDFQSRGRKALEESASVLNEQLSERIETLEQISALQSQSIVNLRNSAVNLRNSSKLAQERVNTAVNSMERSVSDAVPVFRLDPSAFTTPLIALPEAGGELAVPAEIEEIGGRQEFCPKCTSTNVRRANRCGVWEEFLRLFFISPFRCRACRHKFYTF